MEVVINVNKWCSIEVTLYQTRATSDVSTLKKRKISSDMDLSKYFLGIENHFLLIFKPSNPLSFYLLKFAGLLQTFHIFCGCLYRILRDLVRAFVGFMMCL